MKKYGWRRGYEDDDDDDDGGMREDEKRWKRKKMYIFQDRKKI